MKNFLDEHFLLHSKTAQKLYHEYAKNMPIIDYHCHLPQQQIAEDKQFENLTQIWLYGDHYKWRAMRTNGADERYCTGNASDWEKFEKWAETVPYTLRNPLYHWTHLELQRYFDVHKVLSPATAKEIYDECTAKLQTPEYGVRNLLRKMDVRLVCTTDDPVDNLEFHAQLQAERFEIPILPAFRPDAAMNVDNPVNFNNYVSRVEKAANTSVASYSDYLTALKNAMISLPPTVVAFPTMAWKRSMQKTIRKQRSKPSLIKYAAEKSLTSPNAKSSNRPCWSHLQSGTGSVVGYNNTTSAHCVTTIAVCSTNWDPTQVGIPLAISPRQGHWLNSSTAWIVMISLLKPSCITSIQLTMN